MYLLDTNVVSEIRKGDRADKGVQRFFQHVQDEDIPVFLSVVTIGELRRGVELIRRRGDVDQGARLEAWLNRVLAEYSESILDLDSDTAQVWGRLRVPHPENALDKQIAATALIHDLTLATRNERDFHGCVVRLHNPFAASSY